MKAFLTVFLILIPTSIFAFEKELQKEVADYNWRSAEKILRKADTECRRLGNVNKCTDKILFSRAWMYSQRAKHSDNDGEKFLKRARGSYLAVLKNNPTHIATIDNLILVMDQLNDRAQLERILPTLEKLNEKKRAAKVALMIGDLYLAEGNLQLSFDIYNRAYQLQKSVQAANRMISAFELLPNKKNAKRLWDITNVESNLTVRQSVCEAIIRRRSEVKNALWENAAVNWVAWLGRERRLTRDIIVQSIDLQANPEFKELLTQLKDPLLGLKLTDLRISRSTLHTSPRHSGWWTETPSRAWALTVAAWNEGHNHLLRGELKEAKMIWTAALQFTPSTRSYQSAELKDRWAISLELITDLALLLQLHKSELDPQGREFKRIETALFESKLGAYEGNDLQAIQRHHTLMGKMYANLGIFSENQFGFKSAEFQLLNALKTADRRTKQTGVDDPQPVLAQLLAQGFGCKLPGQSGKPSRPINCTSNNLEATRYYTTAVRDFIKLDAVAPARQSLEALKEYQPTPTPVVKQLQSVIDLRANLTNEQLQKGQNHPDIVMQQIELAAQWQALGENAKARESLERAVVQSKSTKIKSEELYQTLKRGNVDEIKRFSREKLLKVPSNSQ